ncbi:MAG: hypothetical protein AB2L12_07720 [Smithellaceae bacterium]
MQAEITFPENTIGTKATRHIKTFRTINHVKGFQQFIEESNWDERLLGYEKYINRLSWGIIIASIIFSTPVCINIFIR